MTRDEILKAAEGDDDVRGPNDEWYLKQSRILPLITALADVAAAAEPLLAEAECHIRMLEEKGVHVAVSWTGDAREALAKLEKELQMTPTDTRQRDELAEALYGEYGDAEPNIKCFKVGYDAGYAECAGEIERLRTEIVQAKSFDLTAAVLAKDVGLAKERDRWREQCETLVGYLRCARYRFSQISDKPTDEGVAQSASEIGLADIASALEQFAAWEAEQKGRAE
jgi:hypothetical protein